MRDEEIGNEYFILRPSGTSGRDINELRAVPRQYVKSLLPASFGSKEEPTQKSGLRETEQPNVHLRRRTESGHTFCLFAIDDPHRGKLAE